MIRFRVVFSCLIIAGGLAVGVPASVASAAASPSAPSAHCQTVNFTSFSTGATTTECVPVSPATSEPDSAGPANAFAGYPADGAVFVLGRRLCSGSVINGGSNHISLVLTAAHCVLYASGGHVKVRTGVWYDPQYDGGPSRFGRWNAVGVAWKGYISCSSRGCTANTEDDYAILVVAKHNGLQVGRVTGYNGWTIDFNTFEPSVRLVGDPTNISHPLTTVSNALIVFPTSGRNLPFWRMASPGFSNGTSGSPWLINFRNGVGIAIGDIGGYQQGGATASPSYSSSWDYSESNFLAVVSEADRIRN